MGQPVSDPPAPQGIHDKLEGCHRFNASK
jgi:hypothetical protein